MNLANRITLFRVLLIPVFLVVFLSGIFQDPERRLIACAIFTAASATDALDGYIARSRNLVTNFGKFMDPLADKLLVAAALICMVESGDLPAWAVIIIISREFIVTGFRLVAASSGVVIAAGWWGKIKTITQMIMIVYVILDLKVFGYIFGAFNSFLIFIAIVFTIVSGVDYLMKNIGVLKD